MTALLNLKVKGTFKAVRYSGSSTHFAAIQHWVETGEYKEPTISTQDIRSNVLKLPDDSAYLINAGDYVVAHYIDAEDVGFRVCSPEELNMFLEIQEEP